MAGWTRRTFRATLAAHMPARKAMKILAIESSCDESAVAYLDVATGGKVRLLEQLVTSQAIHAKYGGVVPEVAAREHSATLPVILEQLAKRITGKADGRALAKKVDLVAATRGPGLVTSLRVGMDTAKSLALAWGKPFLGVNHIEGHVYSNWLRKEGGGVRLMPDLFPAIVLVVSGGHTELLLMKGHGSYRLLGATRDDAAGEAFDKTAKLMGLGYPGGPALSKLAGDPRAHDFPRPMIAEGHLDFSFSGLKTAVRYFLKMEQWRLEDVAFRADVAASVQAAIIDVLVTKTVRAAQQVGVKVVMVAGGVAANGELRRLLAAAVAKHVPGAAFVEPELAFCTDNAAMVAAAAYFRAQRKKKFDDLGKTDADPAWELGRG